MGRLLRRLDTHEMGTGPILPTLLTLGLPAAVAGVMQSLFEMTDTLFVSRLGPNQISGVSLVGPVMFCVFAVAQATNVGIAALVSRRLGQKRPEDARQVVNHGLFMSVLAGVVLWAFFYVGLEPILRHLGGDAQIVPYARQFGQIMFFGIPMMCIGTAADGALRAQGNTVTPMKIGVAANIANAILNPILIFGLHMGVRGSATATLITRSVMCVALVWSLWSKHCSVKPGGFRNVAFRRRLQVIGDMYWLGLPASVGMFAMSISMVLINKLLVGMDPYAVGVMGIAGRLEMFATVPVFALFSAVVPMVGYNVGARQFDRCRQVIWSSAWLAAGVMGASGLVLFSFPSFWFGLFTKDPDMLPLGVQYLRIMMPVYPLIGASIMTSAGFQGLGKAWIAMIMHLWRNLITKLPMAYWFAALWGLGGVWWSFPASTLATAGFSLGWMWLVLRHLEPEPELVPLSETEACAESPEQFHQEL